IVCSLASGQGQKTTITTKGSEPSERHSYKIGFKIDFDDLSYTGTERVRWINRGDKSTSIIYFHLYSNLRSADQGLNLPVTNGAPSDEPHMEISEVLDAAGSPLTYSFDDQGSTLRVNLREQVPAEGATEVSLRFKGSVPEIDPEETGLATH